MILEHRFKMDSKKDNTVCVQQDSFRQISSLDPVLFPVYVKDVDRRSKMERCHYSRVSRIYYSFCCRYNDRILRAGGRQGSGESALIVLCPTETRCGLEITIEWSHHCDVTDIGDLH
ncbi:hypothetical protein J6590_033209 [Homalodisca vitripennis]|nr:hypothetical protein J6590_033209 [Homalodisca vitripennis]